MGPSSLALFKLTGIGLGSLVTEDPGSPHALQQNISCSDGSHRAGCGSVGVQCQPATGQKPLWSSRKSNSCGASANPQPGNQRKQGHGTAQAVDPFSQRRKAPSLETCAVVRTTQLPQAQSQQALPYPPSTEQNQRTSYFGTGRAEGAPSLTCRSSPICRRTCT